MICQSCQQRGVSGGVYCSGCGQQFVAQNSGVTELRLYRLREGKVIGGVCAGVAARWGWDPILLRLALIAMVFFGAGVVIPLYLAAWIVIPKAPLFFTAVPPVNPQEPLPVVA